MTHEYLRGAEDQKLDYLQLKKMARTSLEHAFLPGASLWRDGKNFIIVKRMRERCAGRKAAVGRRATSCCNRSEKAQLQWKLEGAVFASSSSGRAQWRRFLRRMSAAAKKAQ